MSTCHYGGFGWMLSQLKNGESARLARWMPDVRITLQFPDAHSKMTAPYLYVESRNGRVPWNPTQIEILATEWELYIDQEK